MTALREVLKDLEPFLREPLVTSAALARVATRADSVPFEVGGYYLECRLSPPTPELDLLGLLSREPDRAGLSRAGEEAARVDPARELVQLWARGQAAARSAAMWLELDDGPSRIAPGTNVHVCVDPDYARLKEQPNTPYDRAAAELLVVELRQRRVISEQQLEVLRHCLSQLPEGGRLIHVSAMAARGPSETKAYIALPRPTFQGYLAAVLGADLLLHPDTSALLQRLDLLTPWATTELNGASLYCDLTFRSSSCHSVGLVYSQPQLSETKEDPSRRVVRAHLVQEGLCTLAQDSALAAFMAPPLSPPCSFDGTKRLRRWLDFKVSLNRSRLISKAYLGFLPYRSLV